MEKVLNWYVIWFVLYALIISILMGLSIHNNDTIKEVPHPIVFFKLFFVVAAMLVFFSNVAGLGLGLLMLNDALIGGIGKHGFICVLMALVLISHLLLSAKRCKENGVSAWLALIPIYNPLGLFYRKKNIL